MLELSAPAGPLRALIESTLALYDVRWDSGMRRARLDCSVVASPVVERAAGRYLECAQMLVDPETDGLRATTASGASLEGRFDETGERWAMRVPSVLVEAGRWPEIEDMLSLVLTTAWRRAGWVPLHGGGLARDDRGVIVCAGSGGGKTTFTLALVRRGWRSLGDDKLLLDGSGRFQRALAIKHMLNVDPAVAAWFPELGDLRSLPEYSAWTPKRRVSLAALWPAAAAFEVRPTHMVSIVRRPGSGGILAHEMSRAEAIDTLLRQSVIPRDMATARPIIASLARLAQAVRPLRLVVHDDAYDMDSAVAAVEDALR